MGLMARNSDVRDSPLLKSTSLYTIANRLRSEFCAEQLAHQIRIDLHGMAR
jgi:hypothetical protein